jgi:hypothetical protein
VLNISYKTGEGKKKKTNYNLGIDLDVIGFQNTISFIISEQYEA